MASSSGTTTDHDEIRKWVEERGGRPSTVTSPGKGDHAGVLRINFDEPGGDDDDRLEDISWEEFFDKFEESKLAFLHQDQTSGGKESRFFKFVNRD